MTSVSPADLSVGAFSASPPWLIDPAQLRWRAGAAALRSATAGQVPQLLGRRRLPPGRLVSSSVDKVAVRVAELSRAGLSRRLRVAFERLGPTYIKLGQIISSGEGLFPRSWSRVPAAARPGAGRAFEDRSGRSSKRTSALRSRNCSPRFDRVPLAAASIAQVHAATLRPARGGREGAAPGRGADRASGTWPP
jgi:ubiquinone biosynthesis protein